MLELTNIGKSFKTLSSKKEAALKNINLKIKEGEFFVLVGPSGCGKSTLLRIMSGLEKKFDGELKWSTPLAPGDIGFVFQQFAVFPWLTVFENVEAGLISKNLSIEEKRRKVLAELERLGLREVAGHYPKSLSGGMRQRVGIARALVTRPKVIFMDEPFSELDSFTAEDLRQEMLKIWEEQHPTIIMVTHIISEALELADQIAVITAGPGTVEKVITNHLPRPRNLRSPEFFKLEDEIRGLIRRQ